MSSVTLGKLSPFPPLPGQPYPPARKHPWWKEIYRLHDEWIMKYHPFNTEQKRARIPFMNFGGYVTWSIPAAADFDRIMWVSIINGMYFLADDCLDTGKMLDRIPGFKKVATGSGPLHPKDKLEICHDVVFRAIQATCHPRTFQQLSKRTDEFWDTHGHEPYKNLEHYLSLRRVNCGIYWAFATFRCAMDINLTDESFDHPLMREAEGIACDQIGLTNDFFSYAKEKLTNSDDTNILRILQDTKGLTYQQALKFTENLIRQKEQDFIPAALAVLNHPELGSDPEVRRWMACLPYTMGGHMAWAPESARYNLGKGIGDIPFPSMQCQFEETPSDEVADDTDESALRQAVLDVDRVPPPDFTDDVLPIEAEDNC